MVLYLALLLVGSTPAQCLESPRLVGRGGDPAGAEVHDAGTTVPQVREEGGDRASRAQPRGMTWERWVKKLRSQGRYVVKSGLLLYVGFFSVILGLGGAATGGFLRGVLFATLAPSLMFFLYPLWGFLALLLGVLVYSLEILFLASRG